MSVMVNVGMLTFYRKVHNEGTKFAKLNVDRIEY